MTTPMSAATNQDRPGKPRILCVDDEPNVLEALRDTLHRSFDVRVTTSPAEAVEQLKREPTGYAIVLSDMRMPVMDGATFLGQARRFAPDATRMLLTGYADIDAATRAVNSAHLFRFLTKPCQPDELMRACAAALVQHQLVTSERVLLEQTLHGSVKALTDVLALANPAAFGRAVHVRAAVTRLAKAIGMHQPWEVEVAAMLAPIGAVTLPAATAEKLYAGAPLSVHETAMVNRVPEITRRILQHIPRLEGVMRILDNYGRPFSEHAPERIIPLGARILRIARDYDALEAQAIEPATALNMMHSRDGVYDTHLIDAFAKITVSGESVRVREITVADLRARMTLADDVRSTTGHLLIARGHDATEGLVERLRNFADGYVREPLLIFDRAADAE
jgi:response regulator RpfG family c-di-GMP phosphodiesterase